MMDELMEGAIEALFVSHKQRAKKVVFLQLLQMGLM